jgi:hypothetical protein
VASGAGAFTRGTNSTGSPADRKPESRERKPRSQTCKGNVSIRRRCRGPCQSSRRCLEHLWFDLTDHGERYRMPVNDFAVPRMESGKQRPVESMEEVRDCTTASSARSNYVAG